MFPAFGERKIATAGWIGNIRPELKCCFIRRKMDLPVQVPPQAFTAVSAAETPGRLRMRLRDAAGTQAWVSKKQPYGHPDDRAPLGK